MGHIRLGLLPNSKAWKRVKAAIAAGEDAEEVAALAALAAEKALRGSLNDPVLLRSFWLLVQVPLAARGPDFEGDLARLGVDVSYGAGFHDVISGIAEALQHGFARAEYSDDLGEIARLATIESLTGLVAPDLPSLFEPNPAEVQRAFARFSSGDAFSELAREFFARLTQKTLGYYLSRELANHIGPDKRFASQASRNAFETDLDLHCREATRIIKEFAGGWLGKRVYRDGGLREQDAQAFLAVALRKLNSEFQVRRNAD